MRLGERGKFARRSFSTLGAMDIPHHPSPSRSPSLSFPLPPPPPPPPRSLASSVRVLSTFYRTSAPKPVVPFFFASPRVFSPTVFVTRVIPAATAATITAEVDVGLARSPRFLPTTLT
jgi:hypothetical protein